MAKGYGKYGAKSEYGKSNEYGKDYEKGKDKGKKGKGLGPGKEERPAPNSSFAGHCRSRGKWCHTASECWPGHLQGVEEVLHSKKRWRE